MNWLIVALISYFILAAVFLADKYLLTGPIPSPRAYVSYVGMLGLLVLLLCPFVGFSFPGFHQIILSFSAGVFFIFGLFWFYKALRLFESSRVVPALGGLLPIFTFILIYIFSGGREGLSLSGFLSFIFLVSGTVLIVYRKSKKITSGSLKFAALSAFFLAFYFVFSKYVYLSQPFWSGYILIRAGGAIAGAGFFFSSSETRKEIFKNRKPLSGRTAGIFLFNQAMGAGGNILQNWAVALAPLAYLAVINALQGTQYVFLLVFTIFLSLKFPRILKEEISRDIIFQKIAAIMLIGAGLAILAF
jgi:drug/metabolite transporter (DMT)-like permease